MNSYTPDRVINGTFGEVWCDNDYMAEVTGLEAKLKLDTADVQMTGTLKKGTKVIGMSGSGTLKLNKVTSYFLNKVSENIKAGRATRVTIITKLEDPEAFGAERIVLNDCVITELTLADWESGELGEESIPFTFGDFEILESITV